MNAFKRQCLRPSIAETPVEISTPALKQDTIISCSYSLSSFPSIVAHKLHRSQQSCHEFHPFGVVYSHSIFNVPIRHFDQNLKPKGICMLDQAYDDLNIEMKRNLCLTLTVNIWDSASGNINKILEAKMCLINLHSVLFLDSRYSFSKSKQTLAGL